MNPTRKQGTTGRAGAEHAPLVDAVERHHRGGAGRARAAERVLALLESPIWLDCSKNAVSADEVNAIVITC